MQLTQQLKRRCYPVSELHWKAKIQLKIQIWTFGQMDRIRVPLVKYVRKRTFGQMDQQYAGEASQDAQKDFPRLVAMSSNQTNHQRESGFLSK